MTDAARVSDADKLRRRNQELGILNRISEALNQTNALDEALRATLSLVVELLELETGWVWLLRPDSEEPYLAAAQNLPPALAEDPTLMEGSCFCLATFRSGDMTGAANVNVLTCSRLSALSAGTDGFRYHASIPIHALEKRVGVMNVASRDWRELTPDELETLRTVGRLTGIAVERTRLADERRQLGALEERNRLAREIHDTLAQDLTAITVQLESAEAVLDRGLSEAGPARSLVSKALELARRALTDTRRSVLDLRPAPLEGRTLAEALAALGRETEERSPARVRVVVTGGARPLAARIEVGLFRIAQEAVANAARHARAGAVELTLSVAPDNATLVVRDDGSGFDSDALARDRHGLTGMNERARLLGGRLLLSSEPGQGTEVRVIVPLGENA